MKQCIECKKEFEPRHFNQRVCSEDCRKVRLQRVKYTSFLRTKEQHKISNKNWYLKHREHKLQYNKTWRKNNPERMRELTKRWKIELRLKIIVILGDFCKVCGSKQNIQFHEIHGKKHPSNILYIRAHIEDFVCLCGRCHRAKTRLNQLTETQKTALLAI